MQKVLEKNLTKDDILDYFFSNIKTENNLKIGMEFERLPLCQKTFEQVPYFGEKGIKNFLEDFAQKHEWEKITENNFVLGLKKNDTKITLEPGAQVEVSSAPQNSVKEIEEQVSKIESQLDELAKDYGFEFFSMGVTPISTFSDINLIPKKRYFIMSDLLSGKSAKVMMRETAGVQAALDYKSEDDAMVKLKAALLLSPFALAIFSNSPIHAGKNTGYKSFRATAWLDTDNKRCGLVSKRIFDTKNNFDFEQYVDVLLDVPMLYFKRDENYITLPKNFTFKRFMTEGFGGEYPTFDDFLLHLSTYFPDVRLREYLEIRNHDSLPNPLKYAVGAFYRGLLYSEKATDKVFEMLDFLDYYSLSSLRNTTPKFGLKTKIKNKNVNYFAQKLISLALEENEDEQEYLLPIEKLILQGKTQSDVTLGEFLEN